VQRETTRDGHAPKDAAGCTLLRNVNPQRNRPIGITLLASGFLWIGGLGSLIFPIMLLTGATGDLWNLALGHVIHSSGLLHLVSFLLNTLWFGAYILYAFIGYGLWKLRRWAWKSIVAVHWIGVAGGALGCLISASAFHHIAIGIAVIGLLVPYGAILWYLYRPRVQAAFQAAGNVIPQDATPPLPTSGRAIGVVIGLCVLGIAIFAVGLFVGVENMMHSSKIYAIALDRAQKSPCVVSTLGAPIIAGFGISGNISESSNEGSADLQIPLHGPKGNATLQVTGSKIGGIWTVKTLSLADRPNSVDLLASDPTCR
jgi:hypothetical protein